jgi:organic hydroperoxide reductase OsmC/OhrA
MSRVHHYDVETRWTGSRGRGTTGYRDCDRTHVVRAAGRPDIAGSADPSFRGEADRWNPEQLLVAALSQCHMLWFLHLAATAGVVVTDYADAASGTMQEEPDGGGRFTEVVLRPQVTVADPSMLDAVDDVHERAAKLCFIARSVAFGVRHEPAARAIGSAPAS